MEIIHLILGKANPERLNGVNKVVYQLVSEQFKAGKKVSVWGISKDLAHNYPERGFTTELFLAHKNPFKIDKTLERAISEKKDAVFHLHGGWIPIYSSLANLFAKHQIKFVITPHGAYNTIAMKRSRWMKKVYFHLFERKLLEKASKIHLLGKTELEGLHGVFPNDKSFLLPYGFDFQQNQNPAIPYQSGFVIGFMGRLDVYTKGLDLLINSFGNFQKTNPNSQLWILGDGKGKSFLENSIREKQLQNVIFWGKKFGKEKEELLSKMHVFAHPSRNEGLPSSVLEVAALGIPSVVTHATNIAEHIQNYDAGIAIENDSEQELLHAFEKIKKLYDTQNTSHFGRNNIKMLQEVFAWDILVNEYDKLYY
jgi:glycosyltransferase involved in cell wall biosynthesis